MLHACLPARDHGSCTCCDPCRCSAWPLTESFRLGEFSLSLLEQIVQLQQRTGARVRGVQSLQQLGRHHAQVRHAQSAHDDESAGCGGGCGQRSGRDREAGSRGEQSELAGGATSGGRQIQGARLSPLLLCSVAAHSLLVAAALLVVGLWLFSLFVFSLFPFSTGVFAARSISLAPSFWATDSLLSSLSRSGQKGSSGAGEWREGGDEHHLRVGEVSWTDSRR